MMKSVCPERQRGGRERIVFTCMINQIAHVDSTVEINTGMFRSNNTFSLS